MKLVSWKGCLIGCGAVVVLFVLGSVLTGYLLVRKTEFQADATIVVPDSRVYARAMIDGEDELLFNFFFELINGINTQSADLAGMPQFLQSWQTNSTRNDLQRLLPVEMEFTAKGEPPSFGATVGFSIYGGMAKVGYWFWKRNARGKGDVLEHQGMEYIRMVINPGQPDERPMFVSLNKNIFYLASQENTMNAMLEGFSNTVTLSADDRRFRELDLTAPIFGFVGGDPELNLDVILGDQLNVTPPAEIQTVWDQIAWVGFDVDVESVDALKGKVIIDAPPSEAMSAAIEAYFQTVPNQDLEFSYDIQERTDDYRVDFRVAGFQNAAGNFRQMLENQREEATSQPQ